MNGQDHILGIVQGGQFQVLSPSGLAGHTLRLTRMGVQVSAAPESEEIDLSSYEGKALMVQGEESSDWLYSAEVIDEAGPILTALVRRMFDVENV